MNSNTTIDLPKEFREMQVAIEKESSETKPGLRVDALYKKIADMKDKLINGIRIELKVQPIGEINLDVKIGKTVINTASVVINSSYNALTLDSMLRRLETELSLQLSIASTKLLSSLNTETKSAIILAIKGVIQEKMLISDYNGTETDIGQILSKICIAELRKAIKYNIPEITDITTETFGAKKKEIIDNLTITIDDINNRIRALLLEAITPAEDRLYNVVQSFSQWLLSANTGIGVTEGTGMLNGGIHLSVNFGSKCQIGAYLNGELAKNDSTQPSRSLIGLQWRYTCGRFQCDILGSYLFGDKNFNIDRNNSAYEVGVGIGAQWGDFIIGLAGTTKFVAGDINALVDNYVFTFKADDPNSPTFMLGFSHVSDLKYKPVFNISFPIN